jgi:hypothetical protein
MVCFLVPMTVAIILTIVAKRIPEKYKINWLNMLLWGGSLTLAIEHYTHGEIVPYPPFLTAGLAEVFPEMMKIGVPMTLAMVGVWLGMIYFAPKLEKFNPLKKDIKVTA